MNPSDSSRDGNNANNYTIRSSEDLLTGPLLNDDDLLIESHDATNLQSNGKTMVPLPDGFVPSDNDVICGRGKTCYNYIGNQRFRDIVAKYVNEYSETSSKIVKSEILSTIVAEVRKRSANGGFVKKDTKTGRWCEVGDFLAREKTSQAFRDVLHDKYSSSNKAKKKRRQEEQAKASGDKCSNAFQRKPHGVLEAGGGHEKLTSKREFTTNFSGHNSFPNIHQSSMMHLFSGHNSYPNIHHSSFSVEQSFPGDHSIQSEGRRKRNMYEYESTVSLEPNDSNSASRRAVLFRHQNGLETTGSSASGRSANCCFATEVTTGINDCSQNHTTFQAGTNIQSTKGERPASLSADVITRLSASYGSDSKLRDENPFEPTPIFEQSISDMSFTLVDEKDTEEDCVEPK